jgi:hypothetical protein
VCSEAPVGDEAVRAVVRRLSRPHASGGDVIERAAILAEGDLSGPIVDWIVAHAGVPEERAPAASLGLHGSRLSAPAGSGRPPLRYLLPPGALS